MRAPRGHVPLRDCNALLLAVGYAPIYAEPAWDAAEMRVVHRALERMLKQHEPYPALVMDRHWNVLMTNEAAPKFFGQFVDLGRYPKPRNLLRLMFDPQGLRLFVANWEAVAASLFQRVHREAVGGVLDDAMRVLVDELLALPGVDVAWRGGGGVEWFAGGADRVQAGRARVELVLDGEYRGDAADGVGAGAAGGVHVSERRGRGARVEAALADDDIAVMRAAVLA